jgi:His-Xaa-Ser system protein HxsD
MPQKQAKNIKLNQQEGSICVAINPKIYPLDVIYSAAYVFLDRAYILIDGSPEKEVIIELRLKEERKDLHNLEKIGNEFNNELLNYAFYKKQSEKNAPIRQAIMQRALLTSEFSEGAGSADLIEDPEGIAVPWEEKYGKVLDRKDGKEQGK